MKVYFVSSDARPSEYDLSKYFEMLPCLHAAKVDFIKSYDICLVGSLEKIISTYFVLNTYVERIKGYKLTLINDLCRKYKLN